MLGLLIDCLITIDCSSMQLVHVVSGTLGVPAGHLLAGCVRSHWQLCMLQDTTLPLKACVTLSFHARLCAAHCYACWVA